MVGSFHTRTLPYFAPRGPSVRRLLAGILRAVSHSLAQLSRALSATERARTPCTPTWRDGVRVLRGSRRARRRLVCGRQVDRLCARRDPAVRGNVEPQGWGEPQSVESRRSPQGWGDTNVWRSPQPCRRVLLRGTYFSKRVIGSSIRPSLRWQARSRGFQPRPVYLQSYNRGFAPHPGANTLPTRNRDDCHALCFCPTHQPAPKAP
jgi:hypothetical protein